MDSLRSVSPKRHSSASIAIAEGLPADAIVLEEEARNGAENAAFALGLAAKLGYLPPGTQVAGLAPAERSRRLYEELRYQAAAGHFAAKVADGLVQRVSQLDRPVSPR